MNFRPFNFSEDLKVETLTLETLAEGIKGARFYHIDYLSSGVTRGGVTYDNFRGSALYQSMPYESTNRRTVEALQGLDVQALYDGLSPDVLTRPYRKPKKLGGGVVQETLTLDDIKAAVDRAVANLQDREGRAARYTQKGVWSQVSPGVYVKTEDPAVIQVQGYRIPGTYKRHHECEAIRWISNSTKESRANAVVQGWVRSGDIRRFNLDNIQAISLGGVRYERRNGQLVRH